MDAGELEHADDDRDRDDGQDMSMITARRFNAGDLAGSCRAIGGRQLNGLVGRRADDVALCLGGWNYKI